MSDADIWDEFDTGGEGEGDWPDRFEFVDVGDALAGIIARVDKVPTKFGEVPVIDVTRDDGTTVSLMLAHTNLRRQVASARPTKGDRVAIVFTGLGDAKPGKNAPYLYDVVVKRAESASTPEATSAAAKATSASDFM